MINEFITWKDHNRTVENKISKKQDYFNLNFMHS